MDGAGPILSSTPASSSSLQAAFEALFEHFDVGIQVSELIVGLDGEPIDVRLISLNPAWGALTGQEPVACQGKLLWGEVMPELDRSWLDVCRRVVVARETVRFEMEQTAIGKWLDCFACPCGPPSARSYVLMLRDITERRKADEALRASEERFRRLMQHSANVIWRAGVDGSFLGRQESWERFTGQSYEEYQNLGGMNVIHPEDRALVVQRWGEAVEQARPFDMRYRVRHVSGDYRHVVVRGIPLHDEEGKVTEWVGTMEDATETLVAHEELQRERERLEIALRTGRLGVYEWKIGDEQVWWSPELFPLYGVDPESFDTTVSAFNALVHPDDRASLWAQTETCLASREPFEYEYRIVRPDGQVRWIINRSLVFTDAEGRLAGLRGVAMDVTERKLEEQRLAILVSGIGDHLVSYDHDWRYTFVNDAACRVLGRPREELIGQVIWELFPDAVGNAFYHDMHRAAREQRVIRQENYYPPFDRWYENHLYPTAGGVTVFAQDITARKRAEEALREADRRKDEFLATLAHELRGPLSPIRSMLEVLKLSRGDPGMVDQAVDVMDRQLGHLVRLVDELLEVNRISRGKIALKRESILLSDLVRTVVEAARPRLDAAGLEFHVAAPEAPVWLYGDPARLAQVFGNLLGNASQYTKAGGQVWFEATVTPGELVVTVRDTGIGIAPDQLEAVFDMFYQVSKHLERENGGLGIGLALARKLVEMHGGTVSAKSEGLGRGSTFEVRLPTSTRTADPGSKPVRATPRAGRSLAVLVVDDNVDSAKSMAAWLELQGHTANLAHDGEEAVRQAKACSPDVVLLDIGLPKLNGYQACRLIRESGGESRPLVIALTGWGQAEDRRRSQEAGFDAHLVKPVDFGALEKLLAQPPAR